MTHYDVPGARDVDLIELARRLALALADEVAFAGDDAAEESVEVLSEARDILGLQKEFEEIDTLSSGRLNL